MDNEISEEFFTGIRKSLKIHVGVSGSQHRDRTFPDLLFGPSRRPLTGARERVRYGFHRTTLFRIHGEGSRYVPLDQRQSAVKQ